MKKSKDSPIAASELAKLGYCEAKARFDQRHGELPTPLQLDRRREGNEAHRLFHRDAVAYQNRASDRRCFVATYVFGAEAPETIALREFRDSVLIPTHWGCRAVRLYYAVSPGLCRIFPLIPGATWFVRAGLRRFVASRRLTACR